jgi:polysaccharide pyruvyl transferase WcaK-like protein
MANDGNRGDLAILAGTVAALRAAQPGIRVSIAPTEIGRRANLDGAAMADSTALADGQLVASPVPARVDDEWSSWAWGARTAQALGSQLLHRRWLEGKVDSEYREALQEADLVVAKGGSYLFSYPGARQALFAARMVHSLRVAKNVQTPSAVLGTSLGPVQRAMRRYFAATLGSCRAVVTREELSYVFARDQLGLSNARRGVDMAFALYDEERRGGDRAGIAMTPRELPFEPPAARERYEAAVVAMVDKLQAATGERFHFAVQVDRDRALCERLAARVARPEDVEVAHVDSLALPDLIAWYGTRQLLVATRLHSVILAALSHTPSVILECDPPKMIGISEQLGLADWRLPAGSAEIDELPSFALKCYESRDVKQQTFAGRLQGLAAEARKQAVDVLELAR